MVERNVFAGLVDVDPATLRIVPSIARSWSASADGRTFTFDLRAGVRFQHGDGAVTADTFVRDWALPKDGHCYRSRITGSAVGAWNRKPFIRGTG